MIKRKLAPFLILLLCAAGIAAVLIRFQDAPAADVVTATSEPAPSGQIPDVLTIHDQNGNPINLDTGDIPMYKQYLESQEDILTEIRRTQLETLNLSAQERYLLLKYNCGNKQCSTILLKNTDSKSTSISLANGIYQDFKLSPGQDRILLRYAYNEGDSVVRHILIAVDLPSMKILSYASGELAKEYMYAPKWPIVSYRWDNNQQFQIETPDLDSSAFEALQEWNHSGTQATKRAEVSLNPNDRLDAYTVPQ
ncbi:hypothetical protein [Paenibacillus sp. MMS20-IR301]|uniref:hypothetical protein n=1 Tax=Paenibacillus sp. MMS20-IR301 TaxID=2895946 RepID=UPI0028E82B76|nr:hypothetical protein [Paenibacillus sp. MMS20-IR301]WNS40891.1 hypothetical protein LOS79_17730 [Paenibacillus sp. MMS20-IR301]